MTAAYTTLQLVGAVTCDLVDGVNYALKHSGWSPRVATLRTSQLGGRGPYADVEEEITIDVLGATGQDVIDNLTDLMRLCDDAARFARGESVTAVTLQLQLQGSTLAAPVQALIVGGSVELPTTFNDMLMVREIAGVRLRVTRRGQWLGAAQAASGSAVQSGVVSTATFATDSPIRTPVSLSLGTLGSSVSLQAVTMSPGYLLIARASAALGVCIAGNIATGGAPWTNVADAAALGSGTSNNILRYTATTTNEASSPGFSIPNAVGQNYRRLAIYAMVRNNSAIDFLVRIQCSAIVGNLVVTTPVVAIAAGATTPRAVFLGEVASPAANAATSTGLTGMVIYARALNAAGSPTLDFDQLIIMGMDDDTSFAIAWNAFTLTSATTFTINVNDNALTKPSPDMSQTITAGALTGNADYLPYQGDIAIQSTGTTIALCHLMPRSTYWRLASTTPGLLSLTPTFTRHLAYLTPQ